LDVVLVEYLPERIAQDRGWRITDPAAHFEAVDINQRTALQPAVRCEGTQTLLRRSAHGGRFSRTNSSASGPAVDVISAAAASRS